VIELERKTKTLIISAATVLTILSAIAAMVYANGMANATGTITGLAYDYGNYFNGTDMPFGGHGHRGGCGPGMFGGTVTVSQEYKDNVINIAKNDTDVQELTAEGYNVADVRPIISSTVEADGTVTTKATTAIVTMELNTTGRAFVKVDVTQAKVTEIEIFTRKVIEKP
jgi:transposase-like protein